MNALIEILNSYDSNKLIGKPLKNYLNSNYSGSNLNNNINLISKNSSEDFYNLLVKENINKLNRTQKDLNFRYYKEHKPNISLDKSNSISSKISFSNEKQEPKQIKADLLSEVKNFKTELCHSWELTGTCKYGLNVITY